MPHPAGKLRHQAILYHETLDGLPDRVSDR
jgi:hypothetical protein